MSVSTIVIDENADFEVEVIEYEQIVGTRTDILPEGQDVSSNLKAHNTPAITSVTFRVKKDVLLKFPPRAGFWTFFTNCLNSTGFARSGSHKVTLDGKSVKAVEVILRQHQIQMPDDMYDIDSNELRNVVSICKELNISLDNLSVWFETWHGKAQRPEDFKIHKWNLMLLYPCFIFNYAKGFQEYTNYIMYHSRTQIQEDTSTSHWDIHLPGRAIQQLNAARGRLKVILQESSWNLVDKLLRAPCHCKYTTLHGYMKALSDLGVWPLEKVWNKRYSIAEILEALRKFNWEPTTTGCNVCNSTSFTHTVLLAVEKTQSYLDGLCLDCMNQFKTRDDDEDYWLQHTKRDYDGNCRIKHGEPTAYFSFMGRKNKQHKLQAKRGARKAGS